METVSCRAVKTKTTFIKSNHFQGISLAAYKRLLPCALETMATSGEGGQVLAPHLQKVFDVWPKQQRLAMAQIVNMSKRSKAWVRRRKKTFEERRCSLGETTMDAVFRVLWNGAIVFDAEEARERRAKFSKLDVESCILMYSFYTLVIGAPAEVKIKLAEMLAGKLL
jgi:hypothetical protein